MGTTSHLEDTMQNTSRRIGRRAVITGTAMTAVAAVARAQAPATTPEPATTLSNVPLSSSVTVTVERRNEIALIGLNRPFIQNRVDPPTRARLAAAFYQYEHDASLRALVLFGHGE
jgi:enoyl-CoA hydratase